MHIPSSRGGVLDYLALQCATNEVSGGKMYNNGYTKCWDNWHRITKTLLLSCEKEC